jgi:pimeloyl-ACP methyl ester carboxylesterase
MAGLGRRHAPHNRAGLDSSAIAIAPNSDNTQACRSCCFVVDEVRGMQAQLVIAPLPSGIRSRFVEGVNGLRMHVLEAGFETSGRECILLLHGFPELAYSWRKLMLPLAKAGYHVVAPDQRGYGLTTGWDATDLCSFRMLNIVRDAAGLVWALGYRSVASVIGHDFGSPVAALAAMLRPDLFRSVVMMSAPFAGIPPIGSGADHIAVLNDLARLSRPRKHYWWYYSGPTANADMMKCRQGVYDFLRAYFHMKSADWTEDKPFPLQAWRADELAKLPTYYIMDMDKGMAETVAPEMPDGMQVAACRWLSEPELAVYARVFERIGFQGGLNWYRFSTDPRYSAELQLFSDRTIDVPAAFIAGKSDWGVYQAPGAFERMQNEACTRMVACHLIEGAGHWVQQEQPERVAEALVEFMKR